MTDQNLDNARHEVLAENTAQAVHKHLSKLFQEEARFRSRWVWELLQNARDAAPVEGVSVSLVHQMDRVIFRHSGLPFTHKSVAHLIYHGSTKYDLSESSPIGQFGTGFLTTHLISKIVTVKGRTDDGRQFCFQLDRRGSNADELKEVMESSWEAFRRSLAEGKVEEAGDFSTEYEYPLAGSTVGEVVTEGIADLIMNASYLLAFNDQIRSVKVDQPERSVTIEKTGCQSLANIAQCFHVREQSLGQDPVSRYVAVITNDGTSCAVEIEKVGDRWTIADQVHVPRIFVAFPLTSTRDFCLPVVINNEKLQPREDRDTLFLRPNNKGEQHPNMAYIARACDLATRLAVLAAEENWNGAATLARLNPLLQWEWVDVNWFRGALTDRFIRPLRSAEIMMTAADKKVAPAASMIPMTTDTELCYDLWDIAAQLKSISGQLPRRDEAPVWADNLRSWAPNLVKSVEQLNESLTIEKICERVAAWETVTEIKKQLTETADTIEWLNQLHSHISKAGMIGLFEKLRLIPSQSGTLRKISELRQDPGIDEDIKDIAESLGLPMRGDLIDRKMKLKELLELKPMSEGEVLSAALQKFKDKAKTVDEAFSTVAVRFFVWLVQHGEIDKLDGFPIMTRTTAGEDVVLSTLFLDPDRPDERPLAPTLCWPELAQTVADLFPRRQTLSDKYYEALPNKDLWSRLAEEGFVRLNPLYISKRKGMPFIPDEPLPVSEKDKNFRHRTETAVEVSTLAFFANEETGLDAVRRSKIRAVKLLLFLSNYVLEEDPGALDMVEAQCGCGATHRYYRSAWLVPMWDRQWVPLGDSKQSSATPETIAQLFDGRETELRQITSGKGRKLLEALGISLADLSLRAVARDEDTRVSLIDSLTDIVHAAGNDAEKVKLVAEEIRHSPGLLDDIKKHRERREKVQRNQAFGAEVERLLKEALEAHGLKVTRTGVGSDYEIEEDYVEDGNEVILEIGNGRQSFLVEVKATVNNDARMTVKQAETAVENRDRFILCVVSLGSREATLEIVRERCRFITDIGYQIEPVWKEYSRLQETKGEACSRVGEVELIVKDRSAICGERRSMGKL